jgi:hypothetical protein
VPVTARRNQLGRTSSIGLLAVGTLPFALGAVLHVEGGHVDGGVLPCPFRELTGLPCPLCGSTRAVVLASHLDGGFASYNAVMVVVLVALALLGLAGLVASRRGRPLRLPPTRWLVGLGVVVAAVAWVWTLAHHRTIVG